METSRRTASASIRGPATPTPCASSTTAAASPSPSRTCTACATPTGKHDTPARRAQAEALIRMVRTVARPGERLVVCGDFNVLPDSETLDMLRALGLTELVTSRGHAGTRTSLYAKPGRFADYMLVGPEAAVASFDVVAAPEVSDHRALMLELA